MMDVSSTTLWCAVGHRNAFAVPNGFRQAAGCRWLPMCVSLSCAEENKHRVPTPQTLKSCLCQQLLPIFLWHGAQELFKVFWHILEWEISLTTDPLPHPSSLQVLLGEIKYWLVKIFLHPQFPAWSVVAILCAEPGGCWLKNRMDSNICETVRDCIIAFRISVRFQCDSWRSYPVRSSVGDWACKSLSYFKINHNWWHSDSHTGLRVRGLESTFSCGVGGIGSLGQVGLGGWGDRNHYCCGHTVACQHEE